MPNSMELKLVIQTSTTNSAHCALTLVLARLGAAAARGGARSTPARSRTSALASRAASAAAPSASSSAVIVLLPSAMMRLLAKGDGRLEVGAHAHAEILQTQLSAELGKEGKMDRGLLIVRRDAHEAGDVELQLLAAQPQEAGGLLRQHAGLLRLLPGIDLDEERE